MFNLIAAAVPSRPVSSRPVPSRPVPSATSSLQPLDRAAEPPVLVPSLDGLALILLLLTSPEGNLHLDPGTVDDVQSQGHDGQSLAVLRFLQASNLLGMGEELPGPSRVVLVEGRRQERSLNVGVAEPQLAALDPAEAILEGRPASANGLDFCAEKGDAALKLFEDLVVEAGAAIARDIDDGATLGVGALARGGGGRMVVDFAAASGQGMDESMGPGGGPGWCLRASGASRNPSRRLTLSLATDWGARPGDAAAGRNDVGRPQQKGGNGRLPERMDPARDRGSRTTSRHNSTSKF